MNSYRIRTRPHPIAQFLVMLILGPCMLAYGLIYAIGYIAYATLRALTTAGQSRSR